MGAGSGVFGAAGGHGFSSCLLIVEGPFPSCRKDLRVPSSRQVPGLGGRKPRLGCRVPGFFARTAASCCRTPHYPSRIVCWYVWRAKCGFAVSSRATDYRRHRHVQNRVESIAIQSVHAVCAQTFLKATVKEPRNSPSLDLTSRQPLDVNKNLFLGLCDAAVLQEFSFSGLRCYGSELVVHPRTLSLLGGPLRHNCLTLIWTMEIQSQPVNSLPPPEIELHCPECGI